ncbi:MAG: UvrD-helicase domain-containing protein [Culicoidibacterales bacterium]
MVEKEMRFTAQQSQAISTRTPEVLVSAAAGSGKTAVLVERIISIIVEDGITIDRLVVLTFTNAAATQMRQRLKKRLQEQLKETTGRKAFVRKQLLLLPAANICTFHAFCINVLRNNYQYIGLSPTFKIADENEMALLKQEVLQEVLEIAFTEQTQHFVAFASAYITGVRLQEFHQLILAVYEKSRAFVHPQKWRKQAINWLAEEDYLAKLVAAYQQYVINEVRGGQTFFKKNLELLTNFEKHYALFENIIEAFEQVIYLLNADFLAGMDQLSLFDFNKWPAIKKDDKTVQTETLHEAFNKVKKGHKKLVSTAYTADQIGAQQEQLLPFVEQLLCCVNDFEASFLAQKQAKDIADFSDLEHYMIQLLEQYPDVCDQIAAGITELLVDEYQDTNAVQDTILYALKNQGNRIFMVGDLKQSIYRFRLADPTIFMEKQQLFGSHNNQKQELILLNKNFRSTATVLDTINQICQPLFKLDIDYDEGNWLYHGNMGYQKEMDLPTKWHFFDIENYDERANIIQTIEETKADYIISQVLNLVNNETIFDIKKNHQRPIVLSDIAILFRNKTSKLVKAIEQSCQRNNIQYSSAVDRGYFDAIEVNNMLCLLAAIDNPYNTIELLGFMRSPLSFFTDGDIVKIKQVACEQIGEQIAFYSYITWYVEQFAESKLALKLEQMLETLAEFRLQCNINPLSKVLRYIFEQTSYDGFVGSMEDGEIRLANLEVLCSLAKNREQIGANGVRSFIKYMANLQQNNRDFAIAKKSYENTEALELMTIHKSKGLEFPIVFLVDLDKKFNKQDSRAIFQMTQQEGIALRYSDNITKTRTKTWHYDMLVKRQAEEELAEQLRVLYVGLTRPMQQLQLFMDCPTKTEYSMLEKAEILEMKSFAEALNYAYSLKKADFISITVDLTDDFTSQTQPNADQKGEVIKHRTAEVELKVNIDKLTKTYKYNNLQNFAQKQTVTEIKRQTEEVDLPRQLELIVQTENQALELTAIPAFLQKDMSISPTELGTLYHLVLQRYDWEKSEPLEDLLSTFVSNGIISEEQKGYLDTKRLVKMIERIKIDFLLNGYRIFAKELPFSMEYPAQDLYGQKEQFTTEKILVQGKIDMLLVKENKYVIIDFKSDTVKIKNKEEYLAVKYSKQLELYKHAIASYFIDCEVETKIYAIFA